MPYWEDKNKRTLKKMVIKFKNKNNLHRWLQKPRRTGRDPTDLFHQLIIEKDNRRNYIIFKWNAFQLILKSLGNNDINLLFIYLICILLCSNRMNRLTFHINIFGVCIRN